MRRFHFDVTGKIEGIPPDKLPSNRIIYGEDRPFHSHEAGFMYNILTLHVESLASNSILKSRRLAQLRLSMKWNRIARKYKLYWMQGGGSPQAYIKAKTQEEAERKLENMLSEINTESGRISGLNLEIKPHLAFYGSKPTGLRWFFNFN